MRPDNKITLIGSFIWVTCALFFTYEFMLRTVVGTFQHPIMADLHLNAITFALISSTSYQIAYGLMQIPVGFITDRYGLKRTLTLAIGLCSLSILGFGAAHNFPEAIGLRILMGMASSFGFICLLAAVYEWMPNRYSGLFIGLSQFIGTLGPMVAAGPLNTLAQNSASTDWRTIFISLAFIGFGLMILVLLFVKNNPNKPSEHSFRVLQTQTLKESMIQLMRQRQIWLIGLYSASVYFAIEYFSENEGKYFLMQQGYSSEFSSYMLTLAWLGYAIGCPLLGLISDALKKRKPVMIAASMMLIIALIGIIYFPISQSVLMLCFFFFGIGAGGQSIGFATVADNTQQHYRAAGLGLNNAMIMIFTASTAPFIAEILTDISSTATPSVEDFHIAFAAVVVLASVSLVIALFFIKETFCKQVKEPQILHY